MNRTFFWAGVLIGLASPLTAQNASASGFAVRENCTEGLGTAFAGAGSLADDPCTVFNNPAGMTRLEGTQVEFGMTPVFPTVNFHGTNTPAGGNSGNNGGRITAIPNFYAVTHITPDLAAGLAVTSPFGLPIKYNSQWAGRYLAIRYQAMSADINPNIAYKISDKLSIAAGLSAQYATANVEQAINQGLFVPGANDAIVRFKGDNWAFGYNLGILAEPWAGTRIGLTYRSKIDQHLHGDEDFLNVAGPLGPLFPSGPGTADASLPATWGASVTHEISPTWTIASDVQWTQWSSFKTFNIDGPKYSTLQAGYQDTWFTALGAIYHPNETWTFRGGIAWDQSPVTNHYRSPAVPDQDRYMVGLGFGYKFSPTINLDFAYAHYFATHASMNDSINNTDPTGTTINGSYQLSLDFVSASVRFKF